MDKLEIKALCNKDPKEITMIEYQNLKLSMLNQLGRERRTCEGVWCEDCCLSIKGSCKTLEITDTKGGIKEVQKLHQQEGCSALEITHPQKAIELVQEWHKENTLKVDWSTVPVDTKIIVWDNDLKNYKVKRHFAKFENGEIYAWNDGETSWTVEKDKHMSTKWDNAELAEEK